MTIQVVVGRDGDKPIMRNWKDEEALHPDLTFYCDRSGRYYSGREFSYFYVTTAPEGGRWVDRIVERWCVELFKGDTFYCEQSQNYIDARRFTDSEYESSTVCHEYMGYCGSYSFDGDAWYDNEEVEEDRDDTNGIPSYHSQRRNYTIPEGGATFGVELETYCLQYKDAYDRRPPSIIGERDGSLDDDYGVEYIGPPLLLSDYSKDGSVWLEHLANLRQHGAISYNAPGEYGMHVSVGRQNLSMNTQLKFVLFINCNQEFSELIAGRRQNKWANYNLKQQGDVDNAIRDPGCAGRYSATNVEHGRIEVRIFRGTVNTDGFMKNVEYVAAALAYCESAKIEDLDIDKWLIWMNENAQRSSYPHLTKWLVKKEKLSDNGDIDNEENV